jgi:hypothetical protein
MAVMTLSTRPVQAPAESEVDFGVQISGVDLEQLTGTVQDISLPLEARILTPLRC